jgi:hypothetical protein
MTRFFLALIAIALSVVDWRARLCRFHPIGRASWAALADGAGKLFRDASSRTLTLRVTVIGGQSYADDYQVIWCGTEILIADHHRPP